MGWGQSTTPPTKTAASLPDDAATPAPPKASRVCLQQALLGSSTLGLGPGQAEGGGVKGRRPAGPEEGAKAGWRPPTARVRRLHIPPPPGDGGDGIRGHGRADGPSIDGGGRSDGPRIRSMAPLPPAREWGRGWGGGGEGGGGGSPAGAASTTSSTSSSSSSSSSFPTHHRPQWNTNDSSHHRVVDYATVERPGQGAPTGPPVRCAAPPRPASPGRPR